MLHSAKTTVALSTLRTEKIARKRVRALLTKKRRVVQPKMIANGGLRCLVKLLKTFLSYRPKGMKSSGPFYLAAIERLNWLKCGTSDGEQETTALITS